MKWFEIVWPREEGRGGKGEGGGAETCPEVKQGRVGVEEGVQEGGV